MNSEYFLRLAKLSLKPNVYKKDNISLPELNFVATNVPELVVPKFDRLDSNKKSDNLNQNFDDDCEECDAHSIDDINTNLDEYSEQKLISEKWHAFQNEELNISISPSQQEDTCSKSAENKLHCQSSKLCNNFASYSKQPFNNGCQVQSNENLTNKFSSQDSPFSSSSNDSCDKSPDNDSELPSEIAQQIIVKYSGLKDIAGLEEAKQSLREAIIYPTRYPQLFTDGRSAWSRALLFGPPGVGKTALAHAVAAEANLPLYQVSTADLTSAWLGHTEKLIRRLFETLGRRRCILLFDEVDGFCRNRSAGDPAHCRRAATELLIQMQHYEGSEMFLLCATNCPWEIDPAFLRRFQQRIFVPLPEIKAREKILLDNIGHSHNIVPGEAWKKFLKTTEGLTGSDLMNITRSALMLPLREMQSTTHWIETISGRMIPSDKFNSEAICCTIDSIPNHKVSCRQLKIEDLWCALEKTDRTVIKDSLAPFERFIKDHAIK